MTTVARFASSKDESVLYTVSEDADALTCDCRGFTFRQSCLHVAAVVRWRGWHMTIPDEVLPPPVKWQREEDA